jgi:hypothetical protein
VANRQVRSGGGRKKGRNLKWCQSYRLRQQREKNKAIKLVRHLKKHPEDISANAAIALLPKAFVKRAV